jgi:hypothetical protein
VAEGETAGALPPLPTGWDLCRRMEKKLINPGTLFLVSVSLSGCESRA